MEAAKQKLAQLQDGVVRKTAEALKANGQLTDEETVTRDAENKLNALRGQIDETLRTRDQLTASFDQSRAETARQRDAVSEELSRVGSDATAAARELAEATDSLALWVDRHDCVDREYRKLKGIGDLERAGAVLELGALAGERERLNERRRELSARLKDAESENQRLAAEISAAVGRVTLLKDDRCRLQQLARDECSKIDMVRTQSHVTRSLMRFEMAEKNRRSKLSVITMEEMKKSSDGSASAIAELSKPSQKKDEEKMDFSKTDCAM